MKEILDVIIDDRISGHGKKKYLKQFKERFAENKCRWSHFPKCLFADYAFEQGTDAYDTFLNWDRKYGEHIGLVKFSQVKYENEDNNQAKGFLLLSEDYGEESVGHGEIQLKKVPKKAECFIGTDTGRLYITAEIYQKIDMQRISGIQFIPDISSKATKKKYYYLHSGEKISAIETIQADSPDQRTFYYSPDSYYNRPYKLLTDCKNFSVISVLVDGHGEKNTVVSKEVYDHLKDVIKGLTGIPLQ